MLLVMARWYSLEPVDENIFATAAQIYRFPIRLRVSPERVWESLASDESIAAWPAAYLRRLTWTSPRPFGVGTTREVVMPMGLMTVRERFFRWDEGKGYSFYVEAANRPGLRHFAEDYVVEADGDGALLTWTAAIDAKGRLAPVTTMLGPVNKRVFGLFVPAARKYFAANP
jgi:polyketide cyclase/dehydrase/lipid transport protein